MNLRRRTTASTTTMRSFLKSLRCTFLDVCNKYIKCGSSQVGFRQSLFYYNIQHRGFIFVYAPQCAQVLRSWLLVCIMWRYILRWCLRNVLGLKEVYFIVRKYSKFELKIPNKASMIDVRSFLRTNPTTRSLCCMFLDVFRVWGRYNKANVISVFKCFTRNIVKLRLQRLEKIFSAYYNVPARWKLYMC
jgi:hypothetical protein